MQTEVTAVVRVLIAGERADHHGSSADRCREAEVTAMDRVLIAGERGDRHG